LSNLRQFPCGRERSSTLVHTLASWQSAACETFVEHECRASVRGPFVGEISSICADDVGFSILRSRGQTVSRAADNIRHDGKELVLFVLQLEGTCGLQQDGRETRLDTHDLACLDTSRPYRLDLSSSFQQLVVQVPRSAIRNEIGETSRFVARKISPQTAIGKLVVPFLRHSVATLGELPPTQRTGISTASKALLTTAFSDFVFDHTISAGRDIIACRARAIIESRLHDPDLTIDAIAKATSVSLRYLQEIFQHQGTTISSFLWDRRIEHARRQLENPRLPEKPISQIAFACGFTDVAHFSKRFKLAYQVTPTEFRARAKLKSPENPSFEARHECLRTRA
jgi:AraC-like DNA-binding protein